MTNKKPDWKPIVPDNCIYCCRSKTRCFVCGSKTRELLANDGGAICVPCVAELHEKYGKKPATQGEPNA